MFSVLMCVAHVMFYLPLIHSDQEVLLTWDGQIRNVCHLVNNIVDKISAQHSDWVTTVMDSQMSNFIQ